MMTKKETTVLIACVQLFMERGWHYGWTQGRTVFRLKAVPFFKAIYCRLHVRTTRCKNVPSGRCSDLFCQVGKKDGLGKAKINCAFKAVASLRPFFCFVNHGPAYTMFFGRLEIDVDAILPL